MVIEAPHTCIEKYLVHRLQDLIDVFFMILPHILILLYLAEVGYGILVHCV